MEGEQANANEGADPSSGIEKQNPGETTTDDLAKGTGEDRAGAGEGPDADADGIARDEGERPE